LCLKIMLCSPISGASQMVPVGGGGEGRLASTGDPQDMG